MARITTAKLQQMLAEAKAAGDDDRAEDIEAELDIRSGGGDTPSLQDLGIYPPDYAS